MTATTFFVLGRPQGTTGTAMVLDLQASSAAAAKQLVNWQRKGCADYDWAICTRSGPETFTDAAGSEWQAHQSPYTDASWQRFVAGWEA